MKKFRYALLPAIMGATGIAQASAEEILLPPIEVTARQWKENPDKVPESVTSVSEDDLGGPTGDDLNSVAGGIANVAIEQGSTQRRVVMRGMSAANTGLQDPVGYFVDGVALPFGVTQAPGFFGLQRMEIIKGPQAVLYGRNTEAGAIKVETRAPSWEPSASLETSGGFAKGSDGSAPFGSLEGWVSGTVVPDRLAVGLTVWADRARGPFSDRFSGSNNEGDTNRIGLSAAASLVVNDDTDVSLKSTVEQNDLSNRRMRYRSGIYATPRFETNTDTDAKETNTRGIQSLQINRRMGEVELTSITGWTHYARDAQMDLDVGPLPTPATKYSHKDDALSQEVRLSSGEGEARLKWLGGLYTYREWTNLHFASGGLATPRTTRHTKIDQVGIAGFGQVEYEVIERVRLGVGTRLEHIAQQGSQTYAKTATTAAYDTRVETTAFLPRFTAAFDVTPQTMLYASQARGYMPGSYNYAMATDQATFSYKPEYSWTTEVGVKNRTRDGRFGASAAAFRTVTRDKQVVELIPGGVQSYSNASEAEVYGLEFGADAEIAPKLRAFGTLGLQHGEASDYRTATADYSGNRLSMSANYTWATGMTYGEGEGVFAGLKVRGSGPYYFDSANLVRQAAYATVDSEVGYDFGGTRVSLWATNLFDEATYTRGLNTAMGQIVEDNPGREVGVRLKAKW